MVGFDWVTPRRSRMPCPLPLVEGKCSKRHYVNSCPWRVGAHKGWRPGIYSIHPGEPKKLRANPLRGGNHMFRSAIRLCLTTAGCLFIAAAQDQPAYVRDACVKVAPGKSAEYAAMLRDVTAKQMRVRIDDGHAAWWLALSSVVPAGAAARCDYHVVIGYAGFPPEGSAEQTTAELKKAGLNMTSAEYVIGTELQIVAANLSTKDLEIAEIGLWLVERQSGPVFTPETTARLLESPAWRLALTQ